MITVKNNDYDNNNASYRLNRSDFQNERYNGPLTEGWYRQRSDLDCSKWCYICVNGSPSVVVGLSGIAKLIPITSNAHNDWFDTYERCPNQNVQIIF